MALNDKQTRFCEEYLIDFNATQAAIRAGYSEKTAGSQGHDLLKKPEIQSYLSDKSLRIANKLGINQERVLKEMARIAFSDLRQFFDENGQIKPIHELDDDAAAALASMEIDELYEQEGFRKVNIGQTKKIKIWNKKDSLEQLARYLGLYKEDNEQRKIAIPIMTVDPLAGDGKEVDKK